MRNAVEDNQSSGQQEHFEILPMFSTRDKGMRMTVLRPGRRVGRAAPLLPWLLTAMVLWAMTGTVLFGTLLGLAPTPAIGTLLGHPVAVGAAVVLLFAAIIATTGLYSRAAGQFGQRSAAGLFAMLAVTGGLLRMRESSCSGCGSWILRAPSTSRPLRRRRRFRRSSAPSPEPALPSWPPSCS